MMPRKRSILREEASGAIKTLKRLERTNPSVGIDGMNDYQATYNKRWQNQSFLSVNVFTFVPVAGEQTPTAFMACYSNAKS